MKALLELDDGFLKLIDIPQMTHEYRLPVREHLAYSSMVAMESNDPTTLTQRYIVFHLVDRRMENGEPLLIFKGYIPT